MTHVHSWRAHLMELLTVECVGDVYLKSNVPSSLKVFTQEQL